MLSKPTELEISKKIIFISNSNLKIPISKIKTMTIRNYILEMKINFENKIVSRFIKGVDKIECYNLFEHLRGIMYGEIIE